MKVKKIVKLDKKLPVYDIQVKDEHSYILENGTISHNSGFVFASSIVVAMQKLKLKEDEDGNKTSTVYGIRSKCKVMKSRYSKPFEDIEVKIPYDTGMDLYSGLVDLFEKKNLLIKEGNRLKYTDTNGEEHKYFRKALNKNENGILDLIMSEYKNITQNADNDISDEVLEEENIDE